MNGKYISASLVRVGAVKMYTKNGEVTNAQIIQDFLKRNDSGFISGNSTNISEGLIMLDITEENKVTLTDQSVSKSIQAEIINRAGSQVLIARIDSLLLPFYGQSNDRCTNISIKMTKFQPQGKYYNLPGSTGYTGAFKARLVYPVEIKKNQLILPLLTIKVKASNCSCTSVDGMNIFDPNVVKELRDGDTVLYQAKEVTLIRQ